MNKEIKPSQCLERQLSFIDRIIPFPLVGNPKLSDPKCHAKELCHTKTDSKAVMNNAFNHKQFKNTMILNILSFSGDIGYFSEDGHLFIVDRLKELIKYKGTQVSLRIYAVHL